MHRHQLPIPGCYLPGRHAGSNLARETCPSDCNRCVPIPTLDLLVDLSQRERPSRIRHYGQWFFEHWLENISPIPSNVKPA